MTTFNNGTSRNGSVRTTTGGVYKYERHEAKKVVTTSSFDVSYYMPTFMFITAISAAAAWIVSVLF